MHTLKEPVSFSVHWVQLDAGLGMGVGGQEKLHSVHSVEA